MFQNIRQTISKFTGNIFRKEVRRLALTEEDLSVLTENIVSSLSVRQRGAFLITNVADDNQLISNLVEEKLKSRNDDLLLIPVHVRLGGNNQRLSVAIIEQMKKSLQEQGNMAENLKDDFWKSLENSLNEAKQVHRKIDEKTIETLKQWISAASVNVEQGIDLAANMGISPVFSITPKVSVVKKEGTDAQAIIEESEKHRIAFETTINNWDEIKSLNDLHELIDEIGKVTLVFYYDWVEKAKNMLQDPDIQKIQDWFGELSRNGCLGCIFAPVIIVFKLGIWLSSLLLWLIQPVYRLARYRLKNIPAFAVNITGKRIPRLFFVIDGVEGNNFANDVSILTLQSLFRNLNAMFLVFMDEKTYNKFFSM